jgi:hypothetical protein
MLDKIIKIIAGLFGALLLVSGIRWVVDPQGAAGSIGMEVLDGMARSSQLGDLAAFFVTAGGFALLGVLLRKGVLLYTSAALVGFAAVFRSLAWLVNDAPFATNLIVPELVMCAVFLLARQRIDKAG